MPFRSRVQIFGDGAANGPAVPASTTNPTGTSAQNRGVQFGEDVTAAVANRAPYALAENTDDLNARLATFELTGLDAAYRRGLTNVAGGGRVINVDGGPVEARSALATLGAADRYNALFRANMEADTIHGSVGFDATSDTGALPYAMFSARAIHSLTAHGITDPDTGTLNAGGAVPAGLTLAGGDAATGLIPEVDLIEILAGPHAGLYYIVLVAGSVATLRTTRHLAPTFTANTAVSYRVWRQTLRVAPTPVVGGGVTIAGGSQYNGVPALELIPGAPYGERSGVDTGSHIAMRVRQRRVTGVLSPAFWIESNGTCRSGTDPSAGDSGQNVNAAGFGVPGYVHQPPVGAGWGTGYVAYSPTPAEPYLGVVNAQRSRPAFGVSLNGDSVTITGGVASQAGVSGQLIEITSPSTHVGIYVLNNVSGDPWTVRTLAGGSPGWALATGAFAHLLDGVAIGTRYVVPTPAPLAAYTAASAGLPLEDFTTSALRVGVPQLSEQPSGGIATTAAGIVIGNSNHDNPGEAAYLRCVNSRGQGEDFAILPGGYATVRNTLYAPYLMADQFRVRGTQTFEIPISASEAESTWDTAAGRPSWIYVEEDSTAAPWNARRVHSGSVGVYQGVLSFNLQKFLPLGSTITAISYFARTNGVGTSDAVVTQLLRRHATANNAYDEALLATAVLDSGVIVVPANTVVTRTQPLYVRMRYAGSAPTGGSVYGITVTVLRTSIEG